VIVTLGHSYVEAQEINANRVLRRRDSHSAAHKTGCQQSAGTTNYVISAKLVPSFRRHSLKDFEQPKSGFTLLFVRFLLSFRNKDIISYKIMQKNFYFISTLNYMVNGHRNNFWYVLNSKNRCNSAFSISDSLPLVPLKYILKLAYLPSKLRFSGKYLF